jgi:hypothetical protein
VAVRARYRSCLIAAGVLFVLCPAAASGQPTGAPATSAPPTFMARSQVSFLFAALKTPDRRFKWDGRLTFEFDVIDYGRGRLTLTGDYEGVLGRERRLYDLNHTNYSADLSASRRIRAGVYVAAFTKHVSRHLTDRPNQMSISWNVFGARISRPFVAGKTTISTSLDVGGMGQRAFVDYVWTSSALVMLRRPLSPRVGTFAGAAGGVIGLDRSVANRSRICGGRLEGGIEVKGEHGSVELFAGYERRMDAFPTDRFRVRFWTWGFRLVSR